MTVLITGATGNIGSRVVERLIARGHRPRVLVRDGAKARVRFGERVDAVVGDLGDSASIEHAARGVEAIFLLTSGPKLAVMDAGAAKAARAAGVERIVKLSSADAAQQVGTGAWHARGEIAIREAAVRLVALRPTGFMDNVLFWAPGIKAARVVRSSTGEGRIPFVHSEDIAEVAVAVLMQPKRDDATITLTGPVALSYAEMTAKLSTALGVPIAYEMITDDAVRRAHSAFEPDPAMVEAHVGIYRALREGQLAGVADGVARVLGREPIGFDRWVAENVGAFR